MNPHYSHFLRQVPWATFGRREAWFELEKKVNEQVSRISLLKERPKISVVCVFERDGRFNETVDSFIAQSYPYWELLVVCDKAPQSFKADPRISFIEKEYSSFAEAKNIGVEAASGSWIGFVDTGDVLNPAALFTFVAEMERELDSVFFYCNEALLSQDGKTASEFWSKAGPSKFNLRHFNSIGRFFLVKSAIVKGSTPFRSKNSPEEEFGFFLELMQRELPWSHIPQYLYMRRRPELSIAAKRREIVEAHLIQSGLKAYVHLEHDRLDIQPVISNPKSHLISVIILFKDKAEWTVRCLETLHRQIGEVPTEVILVNNLSLPESIEQVQSAARNLGLNFQLVDYPHAFNFGHMHNWAVNNYANGDLLLLLNNDVFLQGEKQLDQMAAWALMESTGTVGVRLHYGNGKVQHSGLDAYFGGKSRMARVGNSQGRDRFFRENHEVFGVTFACCMLKRATFDALGGFRVLDLANGFGDIAFNLECVKRGLHNLYLGGVHGIHLESASRGLNYEYWEECILESEYPSLLQKMVRQDLKIDHLPGDDADVLEAAKEIAYTLVRKRAPWLKKVVQAAKSLKPKIGKVQPFREKRV